MTPLTVKQNLDTEELPSERTFKCWISNLVHTGCECTRFLLSTSTALTFPSFESHGFNDVHSQEVAISAASTGECGGAGCGFIIDWIVLTCSWRPRPLCNHDSTQRAHQTPHSMKRSEVDRYGSSEYCWKTRKHKQGQIHRTVSGA